MSDEEMETMLEPLIFGSIHQIDDELFTDRLLRSEVDLARNPVQRNVFEEITEQSKYRSWDEIREKYNDLLYDDISGECGRQTAFQVLHWVLQGDTDWPFE